MIDNRHIEEAQIINWIKSIWNEPLEDVVPVKVYRSNDWGVTARFKLIGIKQKEKEVICEIRFLPIFKTSPDIYNLLKKVSGERVPHMLFGELKDNKV